MLDERFKIRKRDLHGTLSSVRLCILFYMYVTLLVKGVVYVKSRIFNRERPPLATDTVAKNCFSILLNSEIIELTNDDF